MLTECRHLNTTHRFFTNQCGQRGLRFAISLTTPLRTIHPTEPDAHTCRAHVHLEGVAIYNMNDRSDVFGGVKKPPKSY